MGTAVDKRGWPWPAEIERLMRELGTWKAVAGRIGKRPDAVVDYMWHAYAEEYAEAHPPPPLPAPGSLPTWLLPAGDPRRTAWDRWGDAQQAFAETKLRALRYGGRRDGRTADATLPARVHDCPYCLCATSTTSLDPGGDDLARERAAPDRWAS